METERLQLRQLCLQDAEAMYELAKEKEVGYACGWKPHENLEETKMILEKFLINEKTFAIVDKQSKTLYGVISLEKDNRRMDEQYRELGYWLGKPYWGQGIMVEAANALLCYGFETLELKMISCSHFLFNEQSKRVIEKLGFLYEGVLRDGFQHYQLGRIDIATYSLKPEEFALRNR